MDARYGKNIEVWYSAWWMVEAGQGTGKQLTSEVNESVQTLGTRTTNVPLLSEPADRLQRQRGLPGSA